MKKISVEIRQGIGLILLVGGSGVWLFVLFTFILPFIVNTIGHSIVASNAVVVWLLLLLIIVPFCVIIAAGAYLIGSMEQNNYEFA